MWRTSQHKLILQCKRRVDASQYTAADIIGGEFYDLQRDPQEWRDLYHAEAHASLRQQMTGALLRQLHRQAPVSKKSTVQ